MATLKIVLAFFLLYFETVCSQSQQRFLRDVPQIDGPIDSICGKPIVEPIIPGRMINKITKGDEARPHSWPWQVSLQCIHQRKYQHICGGSIVEKNKILTAAHCLRFSINPNIYRVIVGSHNIVVNDGNSPLSQIYNVKNFTVPKSFDFNNAKFPDDIAVIILTNELQFNEHVRPICMAPLGIPLDSTCYVTGWGQTNTSSEISSEVLRQIDIPMLSTSECQQHDFSPNVYNATKMICAGHREGGKDSCFGDSGGPLVCKENEIWYQFGIVSFGNGCGLKNEPGAYARVSAYYKWVKNISTTTDNNHEGSGSAKSKFPVSKKPVEKENFQSTTIANYGGPDKGGFPVPQNTNESHQIRNNTLSKPTANFSLQFLQLLKKQNKLNNNENLFISPVSIVTLLAMLLDGSAQKTNKQINEAIFKGFTEEQINGFIKNFTGSVKQINEDFGVTFTPSNNIYASNKANVEEDFQKKLNENFNAVFEEKDFQTDPEKAITEINKWVSDDTNNRITELFQSGTISADTSMVLANVNYFEGSWTCLFDARNTTKSKFYINKENSIDVDMMNQENTNFLYHQSENAKVLGLPYGQIEKVFMFIVLPKERFGLDAVEKNLTDKKLLTLISKAANRGYATNLTLPMFKLDKSYNLVEVLKNLGMVDMFNPDAADFLRIDAKKSQYVSTAVHEAFIEVNEVGTIASSVSASLSVKLHGGIINWDSKPERIEFKKISENDKNSFMSPFSIVSALSMLYTGSAGDTKNQLKETVFGGLDDDEEINESFQKINLKLNQTDDAFELNIANRLYSQNSYSLMQTYLDTVQKYYSSEIVPSDFSRSEELRKEINEWVSEKTKGKIDDLLPADFLTPDSKMVLINAIYFKGNWKKEFEESKTEQKQFHSSKEKIIFVDMMSDKNKEFKYGENDECKILAIPYKSQDLAMFVFLPNDMYGLDDFLKNLNGKTFMKYCNSVRNGEVEVELPKFQMEQKSDVVGSLGHLGVIDMFGPKADFTKITGNNDLQVSAIVHKAYIEVNEKGSEAAGATGTGTKRLFESSETKQFIADHPFLFAIVERSSFSLLFLGQYYG